MTGAASRKGSSLIGRTKWILKFKMEEFHRRELEEEEVRREKSLTKVFDQEVS